MATDIFPLPLHCAACDSPLTTTIAREERFGRFGIQECRCSRYPVVAGIPILLHGAIPGSSSASPRICNLIESGHYLDALVECIYPGIRREPASGRIGALLPSNWVRRRKRKAKKRHWLEFREQLLGMLVGEQPMTAEALFDLYFGALGINQPNARDYFKYRFTQPRHLVALAHLNETTLSDAPVLDVGCGAGHVTRFLSLRAQKSSSFGVDQHFPLLFLANHCVAPAANYVCCDVEEGLPFESNVFGAVVCVNMFHFLRKKAFCAGDLKRIIGNDGKIILAALRQRLMPHKTRNLALTPEGYLSLFADMNTHMMDDHDVLRAYLERRSPNADCSRSAESLSGSELISLVAQRHRTIRIPDTIFEDWPHAIGTLGINPMFRVTREDADGSIRLERRFPSEFYADENREMRDYLPRSARVDSDVLSALRSGRWVEGMKKPVDEFVLIDLPERYGFKESIHPLSS